MVRKAIVVGIGLLGAATGLYWAAMIGAAEAGQFTPRQALAMYISCPAILTIFLNFWLVQRPPLRLYYLRNPHVAADEEAKVAHYPKSPSLDKRHREALASTLKSKVQVCDGRGKRDVISATQAHLAFKVRKAGR